MSDDESTEGRWPAAETCPRDLQPPQAWNRNALGSPLDQEDAPCGTSSGCVDEARGHANNLRRRQADRLLVEALSRCEFEGPQYRRFEDELARYGLSVLRGWLLTGTVFQLVAARNHGLQPTDAELTQLATSSGVREEIANATVGKTIPRFRRQALVGRGWSAEGGASLRTYFVGALLSAFPNEFRSWRTQRREWSRQDHGDYIANGLDRGSITDPATLVSGRLWAKELLAEASPREFNILVLHQHGYSYDEIAELLGEDSPRAVEGVLYRWRKTQQKRLRKGTRGEHHE